MGAWDPAYPPGRGQKPPLTPEYQAIYEASLKAQAGGGHGSDLRWTCRTSGMPRIMTAVYPIEIVVEPKTTYILSEYVMPRRIFTDGRAHRRFRGRAPQSASLLPVHVHHTGLPANDPARHGQLVAVSRDAVGTMRRRSC